MHRPHHGPRCGTDGTGGPRPGARWSHGRADAARGDPAGGTDPAAPAGGRGESGPSARESRADAARGDPAGGDGSRRCPGGGRGEVRTGCGRRRAAARCPRAWGCAGRRADDGEEVCRSAGPYGPSASAMRAPWSRSCSRPAGARCGARGSRASCSSMARTLRPPPSTSPSAARPDGARPWSARESASARSRSSVQPARPASRTVARGRSRGDGADVVPPVASTATGDRADGVAQQSRTAGWWWGGPGPRCRSGVRQEEHSTTGPVQCRAGGPGGRGR